MNQTGIDWELHEGLELRRREAIEAAERAHLVRELRAARRAAARARRPSWWARHVLPSRGSRKELLINH